MALKPWIGVLAACLPLAALAAPIEAFTTAEWPIAAPPGLAVTVVHLDEPLRLEAELGGDLGADPEAAKARVRERLNTPRGQALLKAIPEAYSNVLRALELGVARVPAIVFDGRHVVYGVTDVAQAEALYRQRRAETRP